MMTTTPPVRPAETLPPHIAVPSNNHHAGREVFQKIADNIARIMQGQAKATRKLLAALASGGHVLLEDFPGTGKTTLAKALARSVDARFKRIQFTPDLLPWNFCSGTNLFVLKQGGASKQKDNFIGLSGTAQMFAGWWQEMVKS